MTVLITIGRGVIQNIHLTLSLPLPHVSFQYFSHHPCVIIVTKEVAPVSPKPAEQDRPSQRRWRGHQSNITVSPESEFSRKDLTTGCRIAAQENGCRMRRELHTIISICPPVPSLPTLLHPPPAPGTGPSPQAPLGSLGEAAWAMRSFPTFHLQQAASGCWASAA